MGTDIDGWIEYKHILIDEEVWFPAIRLGVLYPIGRDYDAFGYLFGVRNAAIQPVAANRGLPDNVSPEIRQYVSRSIGFFAQSWISYGELKKSGWQGDKYWKPVMKVLEILADLYGEEEVRLIVWFEN